MYVLVGLADEILVLAALAPIGRTIDRAMFVDCLRKEHRKCQKYKQDHHRNINYNFKKGYFPPSFYGCN